MNNQSKLSMYDELLINLTDFICIVDDNDLDKVRSIVQLITDYKIRTKKEIEKKNIKNLK